MRIVGDELEPTASTDQTKARRTIPRMPLVNPAPPGKPASSMSVFPCIMQTSTRFTSSLVTEARFAGYSDYSGMAPLADAEDMTSFNTQFDLLGRLIEATDLRQRTISNNLANVNTPNYRRMDIDFEQQLAKELNSLKDSNGNSSIPAKPEMILTQGLTARADGNNVDINQEIGQLNKNAMMQQTYIQLLSTYLDQMRLAIQGQ